jgi:nicotinate phosphoribosyltransferase
VRAILDAGDCQEIGIFVSGNLDEYAVQALMEQDAPIDGFGIGTRMNTSSDASYLDCAYKLVEYDGRPLRKRSTDKASWPGAKQVFRLAGSDGRMREDVLALMDEIRPGSGLLQPVMRGGRRLGAYPSLPDIRARAQAQIAALPPALRLLDPAAPFPVRVSAKLRQLASLVDASQERHAAAERARWDQDAE